MTNLLNVSEGGVGLLVELGGFTAFARNHGSSAGAALRDHFVSRAMEIGRGHHLTPVRTGEDAILFVGGSERAALDAAFAFGRFSPEHSYFPLHVSLHRGDFVEIDDRGTVLNLAVRVTAAPHPGQSRPAER